LHSRENHPSVPRRLENALRALADLAEKEIVHPGEAKSVQPLKIGGKKAGEKEQSLSTKNGEKGLRIPHSEGGRGKDSSGKKGLYEEKKPQ